MEKESWATTSADQHGFGGSADPARDYRSIPERQSAKLECGFKNGYRATKVSLTVNSEDVVMATVEREMLYAPDWISEEDGVEVWRLT